jgi:hypothetical protein
MFSNNKFIDERAFLIVIAVGTLIIYLVTPTPNILYREEADPNSQNIINFGENTDCYGVKTTEVECPLETESNSPLKNQSGNKNEPQDIPHNLNMNITSVDNKVIQ